MTALVARVAFVVGAVLLAADAHAITVRYTNGATTGLTAEQRAAIDKIAAATETETRRHLPNLTRDITLIVDVNRNVIAETGETGLASSPTLLRWTVDHRRPEGAMAIINTRLRSALLQLMHHLVREWVSSGVEPPTSFWDAIVAEGLANAFAREVSGTPAPWADYPREVTAWLADLRQQPEADVVARFSEWMGEMPDGRKFVGYKIGTYLADQARKNSGRAYDQLANLPVADVLDLAGN